MPHPTTRLLFRDPLSLCNFLLRKFFGRCYLSDALELFESRIKVAVVRKRLELSRTRAGR